MTDCSEALAPHDPLAAARLAAIVESSHDAIIGKDLNSIILSWNSAAERLFGYRADEAIGRSITMLIPEDLLSEETDIITRIKRGERIESYETTRRRKDGSLVSISITVSPIRDANGEIVGASKFARDITATKESERRIAVLLQEVNHRTKNQFTVILSILKEVGRTSRTVAEFEAGMRDRVMGLARSQDLLISSQWAGASLHELVSQQLSPFGRPDQITLSGPLVHLQTNAVQYLGMALHELGTNSAKYGALSTPAGRVNASWELQSASEPCFRFTWSEEAKSIEDDTQPTSRMGFGTTVLERVAPLALSGTAIRSRTSGKLIWTLTAPASAVVLGSDS
ncbi:PAS domain S-box protein [Mesorhizobium sp. RP14(2022)]|uniref:Blue-light-activated histidine kinase n=1 Tax=Mesorhizobium liriopis TaxID=2953882 RepID=A0ABT1C6C9_9HYPH|nr:PAS domain S-box protein [Mesorhizobium liriopis]MCO6050384.1 PAS domain S-box protein [Mesorhizobium liriopis]